MPLAFDSTSHGPIAFGFFNIDTDMLLLEHYFLFANQFCASIANMARADDPAACRDSWDSYIIQQSEQVGDLMGAIHGIRFSGFIGAVYKRFPFPSRPADFKQQPDGHKNRKIVATLIEPYATRRSISVVVQDTAQTVQIGEYRFAFASFQALIRYVWQGGYPRWKNEERPAYVHQMRASVAASKNMLFNTIDFDQDVQALC